MADSMGLMGANNPILQASQLQNQQSAQMRNMAAEGIINKTLQTESKKLGAELDMLTKLATEGQSPTTVNSALKRLGGLLNTDFSDIAFDEDAITELKDIRKLINDKSGNFLPDKVQALFDDYVSRRGKRFISKEEEKGFQESQEQGYLSQGLAAQRQIKATPGLAESPEAMEYAQTETDRLLTSGGTKGMEIAGRKDEASEKSSPFSLAIFEARSGMKPEQRGTPQYGKEYDKWFADTYGYSTYVGRDEMGRPITFNSKGGQGIKVGDESLGTVKPRTDKFVGEETIKETAMSDSLLNGLGAIRELAGKNKQFIGPIEGRWNKLKSNFVNNADFTELDREIESLITMAYGLSGKQITVDEMKMLKQAILPATTQPDANFIVAIDHAEKWIKRNKSNRGALLEESGYVTGPRLRGEKATDGKSNLKSKYGLE